MAQRKAPDCGLLRERREPVARDDHADGLAAESETGADDRHTLVFDDDRRLLLGQTLPNAGREHRRLLTRVIHGLGECGRVNRSEDETVGDFIDADGGAGRRTVLFEGDAPCVGLKEGL